MTDNHVMHTKDRMARIQMETTLAVLGDDRRYHAQEYECRFQLKR